MPRIHGTWAHYVRPGKTDPSRHGSYYSNHSHHDPAWLDADSGNNERHSNSSNRTKKIDRNEKPKKPRGREKSNQTHKELNMAAERPWTKNEDEFLSKMYPRYGADVNKWTHKLRNRSIASIERRANELNIQYAPFVYRGPVNNSKKKKRQK